MMLLVLDAGNTAVKAAIVSGEGVVPLGRIPTADLVGPDAVDLTERLRPLLAGGGLGLDAVDRVILASVVPSLTGAVRAMAASCALPLLEADAGTIPLHVCVPRPDEVGADRLVNAFAAARLHGTPVIVVALGTATTVDAVDVSGAFLGGAIAPGLELGLEALAARAARLPRVLPSLPGRAIGRDTVEAIRSGAVLGHLGAIRELRDRMRRELDPDGRVRIATVVTGGYADVLPLAELGVDAVDPLLTLRGLALLALADPVAAR